MPTLSFTLTDAQITRLRAAAEAVGYPATDAGVRQWTVEWMKQSVRAIEQRKAEEAVAPPADF